MLRKGTLKLLAVEASMLVLGMTLQGIATDNRMVVVAEPVKVENKETEAAEMPVTIPIETETAETKKMEAEETLIYSRDWGAEDAEILLKVAMAEAEGESAEGKALVMLVVLNRVWSDGFPNSVEEVVFQEKQFSVTAEGGRYYTTTPDEDCLEALRLIENGWDESQGALYFESCREESWHSRNLEFLYQVGNHRFYR